DENRPTDDRRGEAHHQGKHVSLHRTSSSLLGHATPRSWRAPGPSPARGAYSGCSRFGRLPRSPARTARSSDRRTAPARDDPLAGPETRSVARAHREARPQAMRESSPRRPRAYETPAEPDPPPYAAIPHLAPSTHAPNGASLPAAHSIGPAAPPSFPVP